MHEAIEIKGPGGFIAALDDDDRRDLIEIGRGRRFRPGSPLLVEGDTPEYVLVTLEGRVKVWCSTDDGREVVLAFRDAGDIYGELAGVDDNPRSASVTAIDHVEALVVPAAAFRKFLTDHPQVALLLMSVLGGRLRDSDQTRIEFGGHDALHRIARRLVYLVERFGEPAPDGVRIALPLTQQDLAGWSGVSRESVNKVLTTMRQRGWIRTHRRGITVIDPDAVASCAL